MGAIKRFFKWMGSYLNAKLCIAVLFITLFISMKEALVGSIMQGGNSDVYLMSFMIWLGVTFITTFFSLIIFIIAYNVRGIYMNIKQRIKDKKSNKRFKKGKQKSN